MKIGSKLFQNVIVGLAALTLGIVGLGVSAFSRAQAAGVTGPIVGIAGKCLDNRGGVLANGNTIELWTCNGTSAQQWTLPGDGTIRIQGYCLAVQHAGTTTKTPVWLYTCDGGPAQHWTQQSNGTLVNPNSGMCLADANQGTADGNPIWIYTCDGGPAQVWKLPAPSVDPSGQSMPVGDISGWHQIFTDNFSTNVSLGNFPAAVSNKWGGYDGSHDTSGHGLYAPKKVVSIQNGVMNMYLHTENGVHLVAAPQPHIGYPDDSMKYGRYVVRFRVPTAIPGYKTAWLLWDDNCAGGWPTCGEIDFPEGDLSSGSTITSNMHYWGATSGSDQDHYDFGVTYTNWHTATLEWTPSAVNVTLDGVTHSTTSRIPQDAMRYILQTETSLGSAPSNTVSGNVQVDWVAVYAKS